MAIGWVLTCCVAGYAIARLGGSRVRGLEAGLWRTVLNIGLPVMLFGGMAGAPLPAEPPWRLWGAYFGATGLTIGVGALAARAGFGCSRPQARVAGLAAAYGNTTLLGVPLVPLLLGPDATGPLLLVLLLHAPLGSAAAVALLEHASGAETLRAALRASAQPIPASMAAGALWALSGPPLPSGLVRAFADVGAVTGPAALVLVGMGLARRDGRSPLALSLGTSFAKLVLHPALVFAAGGLLGLPDGPRAVLTLVAALPTGINVFLLAELHGAGSGAALRHVLVSSLGCGITISAWLWWLRGAQGMGGLP